MIKYPKVSIIITNYNGGRVLIDCIESLKKLDYPNFEVVLVDDCSTDNSFDKAIKNKGGLKLFGFKTKKNLGFVGSNNEGLRHATGKYILLLNNDTKVSKNLLAELVKKMESDKSIGVIQPKIKMMDSPNILDNAGSFITKSGFLIHWGFDKKDSKEYDKEKIIFSAKGACLMTRKKITDKIGLFDDDFISYMEESDFCFRVWLVGYKVYYLPTTFIYHKVGYSYGKLSPETVNYNSFKNRISSLYKNLETKNLFIILIPHILILQCLSIYYLLRLQFKKFSMIINAIDWNVKNVGKLNKKRKKIQEYRVVSDDQIFEKVMKAFNFSEMFKHFLKVEANFSAKRDKQ
jgi:GT2 family glycosyltransferase